MKTKIEFQGTLAELNALAQKLGLDDSAEILCSFSGEQSERAGRRLEMIKVAAREPSKLDAIRAIRLRFGLGLLEAKEWVEAQPELKEIHAPY